MLRERFAHRYHNRTLFGMYSRNHRGESSRRIESSGSSLAGAVGGIGSRRPFGGKLIEADGSPLVDTEALKSMIRLFRVVQVYSETSYTYGSHVRCQTAGAYPI